MLVTKAEQVQEVLNFIARNGTLAYDTETTGLNTRQDKVIGFGISNATESYYIAHLTWDGSQLVEVMSKADCQRILSALLNCRLILWNSSFDIRFTNNYFGVNLLQSVYSDGVLAFHTVQEEGVPFSHRPFGLKNVAAHFYGEEATQEQADLKASVKANGGSGGGDIYRADTAIVAKYCEQDCLLTYRLNEKFEAQIKDEGLWDFYQFEEVMPLMREVLIEMESTGLPVDVPALEAAHVEIVADLQKLEAEILTEIKPLLGEFDEWYLNKEHPPKRTGPFVQAVAELLEPGALPRTEAGAYSFAAKNIKALPEGMLKDWLYEEEIADNIGSNFLEPKLKYLPKEIVKKAQLKMQGDTPMFNLLSKHHLKKLFFDKLKEQPLSTTDLGAPQVDEGFLDSVAAKYAWVPKLIMYNKLTKIKSAYIERLLEEHEAGIWYPSFSLHRTISGRLGSDAQQFPRPLEAGQAPALVVHHNNKIRHFFKAPEDSTFIGSDYESLEPKVFAHVSTDPRLQEIFHKGYDFYSHIAIMTEGLEGVSADKKAPNYLGKINKAKRQAAKPYSLGIPYGMSGYKLQFELNIPQKEADRLVANYLRAFPDLAEWMQSTASHVFTEGRIQVATGRVRRFPRAVLLYNTYGESILHDLELWKKYHNDPPVYERAKKARREFKNYINNGNNVQIQGLAASIVNRACIKISRALKAAGLSTRIVLQVHDEIVCLGPVAENGQVKRIMQECMESVYQLAVPLVAEPQEARTYGGTK